MSSGTDNDELHPEVSRYARARWDSKYPVIVQSSVCTIYTRNKSLNDAEN